MYTYKDYQPIWVQEKVEKKLESPFYFKRPLSTDLVSLKDDLDIEAIKNSIRNIFLVQKNTVPGKPWFGSPLSKDLFDLFDNMKGELIELAIKNAIQIWEPRVNLEKVEVIVMPEFNRFVVNIEFSLVINHKLNVETLSLPFSHNDMTFLDGRPSIAYVSPLSK